MEPLARDVKGKRRDLGDVTDIREELVGFPPLFRAEHVDPPHGFVHAPGGEESLDPVKEFCELGPARVRFQKPQRAHHLYQRHNVARLHPAVKRRLGDPLEVPRQGHGFGMAGVIHVVRADRRRELDQLFAVSCPDLNFPPVDGLQGGAVEDVKQVCEI